MNIIIYNASIQCFNKKISFNMLDIFKSTNYHSIASDHPKLQNSKLLKCLHNDFKRGNNISLIIYIIYI